MLSVYFLLALSVASTLGDITSTETTPTTEPCSNSSCYTLRLNGLDQTLTQARADIASLNSSYQALVTMYQQRVQEFHGDIQSLTQQITTCCGAANQTSGSSTPASTGKLPIEQDAPAWGMGMDKSWAAGGNVTGTQVPITPGAPVNATEGGNNSTNQQMSTPSKPLENDFVGGQTVNGTGGMESTSMKPNSAICATVSAVNLNNITVCPGAGNAVWGLTRRCAKIYVICSLSAKFIQVYNATTFAFITTILNGCSVPTDIASFSDPAGNCSNVTLYVSDKSGVIYQLQDGSDQTPLQIYNSGDSTKVPLLLYCDPATPVLYTCMSGKVYQISNGLSTVLPTPSGFLAKYYIENGSASVLTDGSTVIKMSPSGVMVNTLAPSCAAKIPNPIYLAWGPAGSVFVVDQSGAVYLVTPDLSDCCFVFTVDNAWRITYKQGTQSALVASQGCTDLQNFSVSSYFPII